MQIGAGDEAKAELFTAPTFVGAYRAEGAGTASGCTDPDDDGAGAGGEVINFDTEEILSVNRNSVVV